MFKTYVKDDIIVSLSGFQLKFDPQPTMSEIFLGKINGSYGIGERKEDLIGVFFPGDTLFHKPHLMREHLDQSGFSNVSAVFLSSVYRITKGFVVGTHGLGNGPGCASRPEKMSHGFLSGPDLSKCTVNGFIQINS